MIDPVLRDSLAAFDDAALALLANAGLVRRAHRDLDDGKLRLLVSAADHAEVEADGQLVRIDARGPRASACACKSVAVCRHRIAVVLFLQQLETDTETPDSEAAQIAEPFEIAAAFEPVAIERWAGKANWRAAMELLADVARVDPEQNAIAVHFEGLDEAVRILRGQALDGIVSKVSKTRQKAFHAAAVIAARRHFGLSLPTLGAVSEVPAGSIEVDPAFLDRVATALVEVTSLGFNLAPLPLEESLFELSVSSRADSLPRLAAILRAISTQMRLRRQRSVTFDPDAMLGQTATAYALTCALRAGAPERKEQLAGKLRRDFSPTAPLVLVGCGGERWRTISGARGLTAWFLDTQTGAWYSTTLARGPGQDPQFMPAEVWHSQSYWQAAPLAQLAHARFELTGAAVSSDGRLSAPASTQATVLANKVKPDPEWQGVIRDWAELRQAFLRRSGVGLDAGAGTAVCLLSPSASAPPWFDDLNQQLIWPLRDEAGCWLALTLEHDESATSVIEALESTVREGWRGMVLVKIYRAGDRLAITPLTLFDAEDPVDLSLWRQRSRSQDPKGSNWRDWLERLRRPRSGHKLVPLPRSNTDAALSAAWRLLMDRVEAGPGLAETLDAQLGTHADRLDGFGLPTLAASLRQVSAKSGAELLASAYALMVTRQQRCEMPLLA